MSHSQSQHQCSDCSASFTRASTLKEHCDRKHSQRPLVYNCYHCLYIKLSFNTLNELKNHIRQVHIGDQQDTTSSTEIIFRRVQSDFDGLAEAHLYVFSSPIEERNTIEKIRYNVKVTNAIANLIHKRLQSHTSIRFNVILLCQFRSIDASSNDISDKIFLHLKSTFCTIFGNLRKYLYEEIQQLFQQINGRCDDLLDIEKSGWILHRVENIAIQSLGVSPLMSNSRIAKALCANSRIK